MASACTYPEFVIKYVDVNSPATATATATGESSFSLNLLTPDQTKISFHSLCHTYVSIAQFIGVDNPCYQQVIQNSLSLLIQILKHIPLIASTPDPPAAPATPAAEEVDPELYMSPGSVTAVLRGLQAALLTRDPEVYSLATETLTAFISDAPGE
jgi:hypothetical protein